MSEEPICGLRFERHAPVVWASSGRVPITAGDLVVVATPEGQRLAIVAVAPSQLLEHPFQETPSPRVLRLAEPAEQVEFGRLTAAERDAMDRAAAHCAQRGTAPPIDAWFAADAARLHLLLPQIETDPMEMSVALARLFRVPVELHVGQTFEESALADGPKATALEAGQLVPGVLGVSGSILRRARLNLSARDFIHGRFGRPR